MQVIGLKHMELAVLDVHELAVSALRALKAAHAACARSQISDPALSKSRRGFEWSCTHPMGGWVRDHSLRSLVSSVGSHCATVFATATTPSQHVPILDSSCAQVVHAACC